MSDEGYWIDEEETGPRWWRRKRFYVACEYGRMGPYKKRENALERLTLLRTLDGSKA